VEHMLDVAKEISSIPVQYNKRFRCAYECRKLSAKETLTKYQHEIEEITFRAGLIILKKRIDIPE
jgi:hypothetical protein